MSGVCTWTETLVKIDHHPAGDNRMSYKENYIRNKRMLAIHLSENCMPRHSYIKLHNLFSIISVRSRNHFKKLQLIVSGTIEFVRIQTNRKGNNWGKGEGGTLVFQFVP